MNGGILLMNEWTDRQAGVWTDKLEIDRQTSGRTAEPSRIDSQGLLYGLIRMTGAYRHRTEPHDKTAGTFARAFS